MTSSSRGSSVSLSDAGRRAGRTSPQAASSTRVGELTCRHFLGKAAAGSRRRLRSRRANDAATTTRDPEGVNPLASCPSCGAETRQGDWTCRSCGSPLGTRRQRRAGWRGAGLRSGLLRGADHLRHGAPSNQRRGAAKARGSALPWLLTLAVVAVVAVVAVWFFVLRPSPGAQFLGTWQAKTVTASGTTAADAHHRQERHRLHGRRRRRRRAGQPLPGIAQGRPSRVRLRGAKHRGPAVQDDPRRADGRRRSSHDGGAGHDHLGATVPFGETARFIKAD